MNGNRGLIPSISSLKRKVINIITISKNLFEKDENLLEKINFKNKNIKKVIDKYINHTKSFRCYSEKILVLEENNSPTLNSYLNLIEKEYEYYKNENNKDYIFAEMFKNSLLCTIQYKNEFLIVFEVYNSKSDYALSDSAFNFGSYTNIREMIDEIVLILNDFPFVIIPFIDYKDKYQKNRLKRLLMEIKMDTPNGLRFKKIGEI